MNENLLGWHQFGGRIIPKRALEALVSNPEASPTRLQVGQPVKVKITDQEVTTFADAIVLDFSISKGKAVKYALAFPMDAQDQFYLVVDEFSGAGGFAGLEALFGNEETATGSCIYSLQEYAAYFSNLAPTIAPSQEKTPVVSHLRLVNGV
jgi:hypothetical protein